MKKNKLSSSTDLLESIISLIEKARKHVALSVNSELVLLYWKIGKSINDDFTKMGKADYGKKQIEKLSTELSILYGSGFKKRNLQSFVKFNAVFPDFEILHALSAKLSWTHFRHIIYIEDEIKREFYIQLCIYERWSVRTLQERIDSMLFERTAISKKPEKTISEDLLNLKDAEKMSPNLVFRDPYVLDFLGLHDSYSEKDLESAILANLQNFLIEMGSDFAFIARQKRIIIDNEDFYIDLLFFHRGLKRLVAIDLKLDKFKAAYKGQMELYLRWLEHNEQKEGENTPIGLILCSEKSREQISYLMLDNNEQIKVAEYLTVLPDKKTLERKLNQAIEIAKNALGSDEKEK
ncbi:MAG: cytoplasmic protein [Bacteroidetes bacterium GWF2_43_63]|nr:MAG: cytoplasmic protein [Bacteroidetes bacterium GWE2_42_42]OFY56426.1 MAG: cytoplasmic protein [Bacteroidetes bacterium GWF2_43_63]HBG72010.1 cytoplasmic protein [Bacteroidales bacterium]HCB63036.1 cytoplasmic protein [Bacteroidales bacterium]HCY23254.1 cytoplasmic protein [Bacteroidales bacterium]